MTRTVPELSKSETERLTILAEECAEVIHIVCKILRHGYEETHPNGGPVNREILQQEMGDLQAIKNLMCESNDIDAKVIYNYCDKKRERLGRYTYHQPLLHEGP